MGTLGKSAIFIATACIVAGAFAVAAPPATADDDMRDLLKACRSDGPACLSQVQWVWLGAVSEKSAKKNGICAPNLTQEMADQIGAWLRKAVAANPRLGDQSYNVVMSRALRELYPCKK